MNIKMFLTVTLLGVSLYLGGSSVIYAESAENVTENFEDSFSDCDLEPEMEEDETEASDGGTAEVGFFSADESDNDYERGARRNSAYTCTFYVYCSCTSFSYVLLRLKNDFHTRVTAPCTSYRNHRPLL